MWWILKNKSAWWKENVALQSWNFKYGGQSGSYWRSYIRAKLKVDVKLDIQYSGIGNNQ